MAKWEYAQLQVWDALAAHPIGTVKRDGLAFLITVGGSEHDLQADLGWLDLYNLLGSDGWEFITASYHTHLSGLHECPRHGRLQHFVTMTTFKRRTD